MKVKKVAFKSALNYPNSRTLSGIMLLLIRKLTAA
jgi:hypothetical protein